MNYSLLPDSLRSKPGSGSVPDLVGSFLTPQEIGRVASTSRNALDEFGSGKRIGRFGEESVGVLEQKRGRLLFLLDQIVPENFLQIVGMVRVVKTLRQHISDYLVKLFDPFQFDVHIRMHVSAAFILEEKKEDNYRLKAMIVLMIIDGNLTKIRNVVGAGLGSQGAPYLRYNIQAEEEERFRGRKGPNHEILADVKRLLKLAVDSRQDITSDIRRQLIEEEDEEEEDEEEGGGGSRKRFREGMGGGKTFYKF
jgi:hypothetical protein